jgi:hypothetical protein
MGRCDALRVLVGLLVREDEGIGREVDVEGLDDVLDEAEDCEEEGMLPDGPICR